MVDETETKDKTEIRKKVSKDKPSESKRPPTEVIPKLTAYILYQINIQLDTFKTNDENIF